MRERTEFWWKKSKNSQISGDISQVRYELDIVQMSK